MKIKQITSQHRRDFSAIYECEHCGHETKEQGGGYDGAFYHNNVIPKMQCPECEKTASDDYRPLTTKYPDGMVV